MQLIGKSEDGIANMPGIPFDCAVTFQIRQKVMDLTKTYHFIIPIFNTLFEFPRF
jgi:hypothetical protein